MVELGWWPHNIEFDTLDLITVVDVINERNRKHRRGR